MELLPIIEKRVSIRQFTGKEIDKGALHRILEAGVRAPSAKNSQPWRFITIIDPELKHKVMEYSFGEEHVGKSGAIIAACTTNIDYRMPNGQFSYPIDMGFAVAFMMMQTEAEGLGGCVVTTFDETGLKELLSVPYSMRIVMLFVIGEPAERPLPTQRKAFNRVVAYNHW